MYKFYWNNLPKSSSKSACRATSPATVVVEGEDSLKTNTHTDMSSTTTNTTTRLGGGGGGGCCHRHVVKPSGGGGSCCSSTASNGSSCTSSYSGSSDSTSLSLNNQSSNGVQSGQMPLLVCGKGSSLPLSSASIVPEIPYRNGVTVRVKDENNPSKSHNPNNNNNNNPSQNHGSSGAGGGNPSSGSHRVLLKLRRMSGGGSSSSSRPKSVPDSSELLDGVVNGSATFANLADLKLGSNGNVDQHKSSNCKSNKPSKMKSSKSLHHFYNKTWNEKSLSKFLRHDSGENQHNYENIYNSDKESSATSGTSIFGSSATNSYHPVYENMYLRTTACFSSLNPTINNNNGALKINQLTQSPTLHARAARNRDRNRPLGGSTDQDRAPNSQGQQQKPLFRSKSCERPKMRDTVRDTLKISTDKFHSNLSRFSAKFGHSPTISNFSQVDGECDNYSILAQQPYSNKSSGFDEDPEVRWQHCYYDYLWEALRVCIPFSCTS